MLLKGKARNCEVDECYEDSVVDVDAGVGVCVYGADEITILLCLFQFWT